MTTTSAAPAAPTDMVIATTNTGRMVHMSLSGRRPLCGPKGGEVDQVLGTLGEGIEGTLAGLATAAVAPSRLCGHCFYAQTRMAYRAFVKAAK
jgi:hypothetical protein